MTNPAELSKLAPMATAKPELKPVGPHWGTYTPSSNPAYMQSFGKSASVHAEGQEVRTIAYSENNEVKISTEANVEVFKIGGEFGAGFVIQRAENTYNQYILNCTLTAQLIAPYTDVDYNLGSMPMVNFASSLVCYQYGILRNE